MSTTEAAAAPDAEVTETGGEYKTSENAKKGVADILAADSEDESLRKYKESLLGAAAAGRPSPAFLLLQIDIFFLHFFSSILLPPLSFPMTLSLP